MIILFHPQNLKVNSYIYSCSDPLSPTVSSESSSKRLNSNNMNEFGEIENEQNSLNKDSVSPVDNYIENPKFTVTERINEDLKNENGDTPRSKSKRKQYSYLKK